MRTVRVFLVSVLILVVSGMSLYAATPADTLVIAEKEQPASFDPIGAYNTTVNRVMLCAYDSLFTYKAGTTELIPALVNLWEISSDSLTYILHLQEGVKFHDGTELIAEDVKFTLDRTKALNIGIAGDLSNYEGSIIIDNYEIQIKLNKPYAPFSVFLAKVFVLNKDLTLQHEQDGDWGRTWLKTNEAGSGPYILSQFRPEEIAVFDKFDAYWRGWEGKHVSKVVFRFIKEGVTQRLLLQQGDVDLAQQPPMQDLADLRANPDIQVVSTPTLATYYIFMNVQKPPLDNKLVRQALSYAYDYEAHIQFILKGEGYRPHGYIPEAVPFYYSDKSIYPYEYNLDKARELLAEAGYPDGGFTLDMAYLPVLEEEVGTLETMQDACAKLGITIKPRGMTWPTFVDAVTNFDTAPMLSTVYSYPSYPDIHAYLSVNFDCKYVGQWSNYSWYCNPAFSALTDKAISTSDPEVRRELYKWAQIILDSDAAAIPISVKNFVVALRTNVHGYAHTPAYQEGVNVYDIYKD